MTSEQIRGMYAETMARARFERWGYADELWPDMAPELMRKAYQDVDALAAKGLLPTTVMPLSSPRRIVLCTPWMNAS